MKRKTDWLLVSYNRFKNRLVRFFSKIKNSFYNQDDTTFLGRVALFCKKHDRLITIAMIAVQTLFIFI